MDLRLYFYGESVMAQSMNLVILIGNLGRDPDVKTTGNGTMAILNVATSKSWKDRNSGERKEKTQWHKVVVYGPAAEFAAKYLHKGSKLSVQGELQTREYTPEDGIKRFATEIIVAQYDGTLIPLDGPSGQNDGQSSNNGSSSRRQSNQPPAGQEWAPPDDSDIPF
jgi:single-strand DNA-binding protein